MDVVQLATELVTIDSTTGREGRIVGVVAAWLQAAMMVAAESLAAAGPELGESAVDGLLDVLTSLRTLLAEEAS